jgi:hypothetical protein
MTKRRWETNTTHWLKKPRAPTARGSFAGESGTNQPELRQLTPSLLVLVYA